MSNLSFSDTEYAVSLARDFAIGVATNQEDLMTRGAPATHIDFEQIMLKELERSRQEIFARFQKMAGSIAYKL